MHFKWEEGNNQESMVVVFGRKNFDMNNTFSNNSCNSMEEKRKYFMMGK